MNSLESLCVLCVFIHFILLLLQPLWSPHLDLVWIQVETPLLWLESVTRQSQSEPFNDCPTVGRIARPTNGIRKAGPGAAGMGSDVSVSGARGLWPNWGRTVSG